MKPAVTTASITGAVWLVLLSLSCSTPPKPPAPVSGVVIITEGMGSPPARWRKADLLARYGPPLGVVKRGASMEYEILTYAPSRYSGKVFLLFRGEQLLSCVDENSVAALGTMIQSDQKARKERVILLTTPFQDQQIEYSISEQLLPLLPKWRPETGSAPPVSEEQGRALARLWRDRNLPELTGEPVVQRVVEFQCCPGHSGYLVGLGVGRPEPTPLDDVIVLMDESVVAGELASAETAGGGLSETGSHQAGAMAGGAPTTTADQNVSRVMIEGRNTYFLVDLDKLKAAGKRSGAGKGRLSAAEAEQLARQWLNRTAPELQGCPKVSQLPSEPGLAKTYYHVDLGAIAVPLRLQEILVLMDGTIVESALK